MFTERDRQIYTCPHTARKYDPLAVKRTLAVQSKRQINKWIADAQQTDDPGKADVAIGNLVAVARVAFALPAVDPKTGEGVPEATVYESFVAFTVWLRGKDEREQRTLSSAPCSGCP
jgi:hypothetical protein